MELRDGWKLIGGCGSYRVVALSTGFVTGLHVVGEHLCLPVASVAAGERVIADLLDLPGERSGNLVT